METLVFRHTFPLRVFAARARKPPETPGNPRKPPSSGPGNPYHNNRPPTTICSATAPPPLLSRPRAPCCECPQALPAPVATSEEPTLPSWGGRPGKILLRFVWGHWAPREGEPPPGGCRPGSGPTQWPVSSGGRPRALGP